MEAAWQANPSSGILTTELIRTFAKRGDLDKSEEIYEEFRKHGHDSAVPHLANALVEALFEAGSTTKAQRLLDRISTVAFGQDAIDAAILARRLGDSGRAHRHFERAGEALQGDPRALHEFAQTKIDSAGKAFRARHHARRTADCLARPACSWNACSSWKPRRPVGRGHGGTWQELWIGCASLFTRSKKHTATRCVCCQTSRGSQTS